MKYYRLKQIKENSHLKDLWLALVYIQALVLKRIAVAVQLESIASIESKDPEEVT